MDPKLLPFVDYWWFYVAFCALIGVLLFVDLRFHRESKLVSMREAFAWTGGWVALALGFSVALYFVISLQHPPEIARQLSLEFIAGYVVEWSLSVDNMFVFAMVFLYFGVPAQFQHRVLFYGVMGAMVFRAIFIAVGSLLIQFHLVMVVFGLFLIFTAFKMAFEDDRRIDPGSSIIVKWTRRLLPVTTQMDGERFFRRIGGVLHMTPLIVVLVFLEATDIVFAIDSVPAVFGVTREPLIVYTSNVFAILGLRSLYFVLANALDLFHALKYGLSLVLGFVGLKMVWLDGYSGGRFPIGLSVAIIVTFIGASILYSLVFPANTLKSRVLEGLLWPAVGLMYLLLGSLAMLLALDVMEFAWFPDIANSSLLLSGGCYLFCAVFLFAYIKSRWSHRL